MKKLILTALVIAFISCYPPALSETINKPNIQRSITYKQPEDISQYWLSEKLDGVRGYWDGEKLYFRSGNLIHSPIWFTNNWPSTPLDGELWIARDKFNQVSSCTRKLTPTKCWQEVRFMVFDLPKHQGTFNQRVHQMNQLSSLNKSPYLAIINQFTCPTSQCLYRHFEQIIAHRGEGLMLHAGNAYYKAGVNPALMKLKPYFDAEAKVIEHIGGKGKYKGMLGSILVKTPEGIEFRIGSGFSDQQRKEPPPIGTLITYKYSGKTHKGVPRFASFIRIRKE